MPHGQQLCLSVFSSDAKPVLKLRRVGEDVQREDIAEEFKSVLVVQVGMQPSSTLGHSTLDKDRYFLILDLADLTRSRQAS